MTIAELITKLNEFPPTDLVEIFIGDLENKGISTLMPATEVIRCPLRLGVMRFLSANSTVWIK